MGIKKTNSAAEAVAELTKVYNVALEVQKNLSEDATEQQITEAKTAVDEAKAKLDEAVANVKAPVVKALKKVKVKFLLSPVAKFGLAYLEGEEGELLEAQATELVEAKYAEFVK